MSLFIELLYKALDTPLGIVVRTDDPERCRAKLYEARRSAENPEFETLTIKPSNSQPETHIWIVRKDQANAPKV